ncbi:MAG TPA: hypothetical protein VLZ30_11565, partial [Verrucomicrobiae bacterium]|nr:hypothetical protein [Verrucomicrobiae bacterium]
MVEIGVTSLVIFSKPEAAPHRGIHHLDVTGDVHELKHCGLKVGVLPDLRPKRIDGSPHSAREKVLCVGQLYDHCAFFFWMEKHFSLPPLWQDMVHEVAQDQEALDFVGALVDVEDAGIAAV